jgi:hypothetical protein
MNVDQTILDFKSKFKILDIIDLFQDKSELTNRLSLIKKYHYAHDEKILISECVKISNLKTLSSDIISYGPIVSNLHKDLTYSKRISYIDRNNTGTVKIWIISISSTTRMNKLISIDKHKLTPSDVIKHIIFQHPQNFQILIQI